jgi:hypothetical protein
MTIDIAHELERTRKAKANGNTEPPPRPRMSMSYTSSCIASTSAGSLTGSDPSMMASRGIGGISYGFSIGSGR